MRKPEGDPDLHRDGHNLPVWQRWEHSPVLQPRVRARVLRMTPHAVTVRVFAAPDVPRGYGQTWSAAAAAHESPSA
jgi:hypothetical protein